MKRNALFVLLIGLFFSLFCFIAILIIYFAKPDFALNHTYTIVSLTILGFLFLGYAIWNTHILKKVGHDTTIMSENSERIKFLQEAMESNTQLFQDQIQLLHKVVEERSHYDRWQLKNSPIGVLMFFADGRIDIDYSEICHRFFGENFTSRLIQDVLYADEKAVQYFKEWLEVAALERVPLTDLIGLLHCETQLPDRSTNSNKKAKAKMLDLAYQFVPVTKADQPKKLDRMIVFVMNVTAEKKLEKTLANKESQLEFLLNILRNRKNYRKFLELCYQSIEEAESVIARLLEGNLQENVDILYRLIHTIRGNAATFNVRSLRDLGDSIEKLLQAGKEGVLIIDTTFQTQLQNLLPQLKDGLLTHIQETEKIFNETFDPRKSEIEFFSISQSYLKELQETIHLVENQEIKENLLRKTKEISRTKIGKILAQYADIVQQAGLRKDKKLSPLSINGGDVLVDAKKLEAFFAVFIHLVINSVDHGIETPKERIERQKPEEGIIRIRAQAADKGLYISIEDDGRGIDPEALTQKALQKNLITKNHISAMTLEDKYNLIFRQGFSTSHRMTSTSGRGVGLSAVKHEVDKLNGTIKISSKIHKGAMFTIYLPVEAD